MTNKEKQQWIDTPVKWDDYPDNPTREEAKAERERIENEVKE